MKSNTRGVRQSLWKAGLAYVAPGRAGEVGGRFRAHPAVCTGTKTAPGTPLRTTCSAQGDRLPCGSSLLLYHGCLTSTCPASRLLAAAEAPVFTHNHHLLIYTSPKRHRHGDAH